MPWHLIPINIYFGLCMIVFTFLDFRGAFIRRLVKSETGAEIRSIIGLNINPPAGLRELVAIRPELDYPMRVPRHIVPCGPILRPAPPVTESDPELAAWLARGPTVLINQGTHAETNERNALQMAGALKQLFDAAELRGKVGRLQVLWKVNKHGNYELDKPGCKTYELLGKQIDQDRVRMVQWISAEPHSILLTGHVICSVNHGGANVFFEALGYVIQSFRDARHQSVRGMRQFH